MYKRRIFTTDPDYFPLEKMQEIISYLHDHEQKYGMFPVSSCNVAAPGVLTDVSSQF